MNADPVATAWERCRAARPDVAASLEQFRSYLVRHRPTDVTEADQLATWCLDDIYLVCACVNGSIAALRAVEAEVIPIIDLALTTWDRAVVDETRQQLRAMLLVD